LDDPDRSKQFPVSWFWDIVRRRRQSGLKEYRMEKFDKVLVTGGGGFISGHLVAALIREGHSKLRRREADSRRCRAAARERCLSGDAGGRLWLGKLFSERMCRHFHEDYGFVTRIARYHKVYGPNGIYDGGREKAPAAICRKVIAAKLTGSGEMEIWGDGWQTRSFMYIDDCINGTLLIFEIDETEPLNLASDRLVTINQMVDIVEDIGGIKLRRRYNLSAPQGVRGRSSDNTLITERLGWSPAIPLEVGLEQTYRWIYGHMTGSGCRAG
jgi:nucleoside-diphosphate-sugar epimerase